MEKTTEKRTAILPIIRLTPSEKIAIDNEFKGAPFPNKSAFLRYKLLNKKYSEYKKMEYEAEIAAGKMVTQLNQLGNNINQIARRLNSQKEENLKKKEVVILASTAKLLLQIKKILTQNIEK